MVDRQGSGFFLPCKLVEQITTLEMQDAIISEGHGQSKILASGVAGGEMMLSHSATVAGKQNN
jgi:hypothetical protein